MKKLAIFDLDGTLLNTIEDLGTAANYALEKNGFPTHAIAAYPFLVGNGVKRLLQRVLPEESASTENVMKLLVDFKEYYDKHNTDFTAPYDGINQLLSNLVDKGVKLAVASNKYQSATENIVAHYFPNYEFVAVSGQKEGVPVKPDPSIVFEILGLAQIPKAETIYIGDSGVDMETARRACVDSIGVTWGFRSEKELTTYLAGNIAHSPQEVLEIIESFDKFDTNL
jgi:haloacid dehalogenase superfamily, subfamily IA, variant 1 with third motif having Dx(3-4)D or Dx(3-4)E